VSGAVAYLNDYVAYRPIACWRRDRHTDYYPHEKVRPIPLYLQGAGVTPSKYADLVRPLWNCSPNRTRAAREACFDPQKLDELSLTRAPRPLPPMNQGPNVLFGEWTADDRQRGYLRRFVLRQMTLDTLLTWVTRTP